MAISTAHPSNRSDWLRDATSMLVSAAFHFTALIVIGLIAVGGSRGLQGSKITVDITKGGDRPQTAVVDATPLDDGSASGNKLPDVAASSAADAAPIDSSK